MVLGLKPQSSEWGVSQPNLAGKATVLYVVWYPTLLSKALQDRPSYGKSEAAKGPIVVEVGCRRSGLRRGFSPTTL